MNNEIINEYLKDICSYVKNKDVHEEISDEIREHLYEIVDEHISDGMSEDEAVNEAIKRLGSAYECGIKLNKVHKVKPDIITIILSLALAIIGIITIYSIEKNSISSETFSFDNIIGLIIGAIIAIGIYFFDYRKIKRYSYHIYLAAIIILMITSFMADSFFTIKFGRFSESQISFHLAVTILLLIALSGVINIKSINNKTDIIYIGSMGIIPLLLFFIARDVTVGLVYLSGINVIFLSSKVKRSFKISLIGVEFVFAILVILFGVLSEPYRLARFYSLIDPARDPKGNGYVNTRIRELLSKATLYGNEMNVEKFELGDLKSNFTLIYIISNFGIAFGGICISIVMTFVARIFTIMNKVKDSYGRTIILSIGYMFFMQIIINMFSNLGFFAVYIGLPFICFGTINSITSIIMIGLLCSIYRRRGLKDRSPANLQV